MPRRRQGRAGRAHGWLQCPGLLLVLARMALVVRRNGHFERWRQSAAAGTSGRWPPSGRARCVFVLPYQISAAPPLPVSDYGASTIVQHYPNMLKPNLRCEPLMPDYSMYRGASKSAHLPIPCLRGAILMPLSESSQDLHRNRPGTDNRKGRR